MARIDDGAKGVATVLAVAFITTAAAAHDSFISRNRLTDPQSGEWCCNHIDCAAVPGGGIREVSGGYVVEETAETIPYARVIWKSEDGRWWRCRYTNGERAGQTRCLIGPPAGS